MDDAFLMLISMVAIRLQPWSLPTNARSCRVFCEAETLFARRAMNHERKMDRGGFLILEAADAGWILHRK